MQYKLIEEHAGVSAGSIVFKSTVYDYGLAAEDTKDTGIMHVSVSQKKDGCYPLITVPVYKLERA
jgi:hypothetical protein